MSEITWSLMHPTSIDAEYMRRMARKAVEYGEVDSFEICGAFASPLGGMNGLTLLEPYPIAHAKCDQAGVLKQRETLNEIVAIAHSIGKPLYFWHREIMIPKGVLEDAPEMMDECGEFDLLGKPFQDFLRFKIAETFRLVPELDGIVLTLTEADFSVIHNSRPDRYPPRRVVKEIIEIFAEEHQKRGKRFILRSFGSIARDYEDILDGARLAAEKYEFDIETKITPYDFVPFLPPNPFLVNLPNTRLNVECDCLGEYLGAGYLPACNVANIKRYVAEGMAKNVQRYAIRLDRIGNCIFDSSHEINLFAYTEFIRNPERTVEQVMAEYAAKRYPQCATEMTELQNLGLSLVTYTNYAAKNAVIHKFPILPDFKWVRAGGSFGVFRDGWDLHMLRDIWSIRTDEKTPGRQRLLAEKDEAVRLADRGLKLLESIKDKLSESEYKLHLRAWKIAAQAAVAFRSFFRCAAAYFDDMDNLAQVPKKLRAAVKSADAEISALMARPDGPPPTMASCCDGAALPGDDLDRVYFAGLRFLSNELLNEYVAELAVRKTLNQRPEVVDFVIAGGIYDDVRIGRVMHASHARLHNGHPVRDVGNTVFPNGEVAVEFHTEVGDELEVTLDCDYTEFFDWAINDGEFQTATAIDGKYLISVRKSGLITLRLAKHGKLYPAVISIAQLRH